MKIAYCSDLHLEHGGIELLNTENADVLVLAGDILNINCLKEQPDGGYTGWRQIASSVFIKFLNQVSKEFPYIVYVAGNHEFYDGRFHESLKDIKEYLKKYPNIFFLEDEVVDIAGVVFMGATLWTDLNGYDPLTLHAVSAMLADYKWIRDDSHGFCKLKPASTAYRHDRSRNYFEFMLSEFRDRDFVIVSHHAPSSLSIHEMYKHDHLMNGAYHSRLEEFILDRPNIKLWFHGHMHNEFDYNIGDTRVLCNPRGYDKVEVCATTFNLKYIEI